MDMPTLYREHRAEALRIARRILRDPCDAEDVVQEVFVRLWQRPDTFDGRSRLSTWLYRVMINESINGLRARRRRQRQRARAAERLDDPPSPEELAVTAQLRQSFHRHLRELGGLGEQVVWMREVRGYSYPDIAALLGVPEGTVKSALHRARARVFAVMVAEAEGT